MMAPTYAWKRQILAAKIDARVNRYPLRMKVKFKIENFFMDI